MPLPFVFKQFRLEQSQSAFKLGTDSVLLGAWLPDRRYQKILDIGGGTGILSLMMAQRFNARQIVSVESDAGSASDKANNFAQSIWSDRLVSINADIFDWSKENITGKFDLIISNPPYFTNDLQNPDSKKANARHTGNLNAESMADLILTHLEPTGCFACILPIREFDNWKDVLEEKRIYLNQFCHIRSFDHSEIVRKAGLFSLEQLLPIGEDQFIYNNDKTRSDWYTQITADFYIK